MNQATFISSNKGGKILVGAHHFEYRRRKARGSTVYYACREAESMKCKATASTIESDGVIYIKADPNPSRKERRSERLEKLKISLDSYRTEHIKKFLFVNRDTLC